MAWSVCPPHPFAFSSRDTHTRTQSAALLYFALMLYVVLGVLNEIRPAWFFILSAFLFVLSQLAYFLLNKVICEGVQQKLDGSFVATILETAAVAVIYFGWRGITEGQSHLTNLTLFKTYTVLVDAWSSEAYYR